MTTNFTKNSLSGGEPLCSCVTCKWLGRGAGYIFLAQLFCRSTSSCRDSHRRWRWEWRRLRSPASKDWKVQMTGSFHRGSRELAGSWSPWCPVLLTDLCGKNGGQTTAPPALPFWGFPWWESGGEIWLLLVYNPPCNIITRDLQSIEQEQAWWLGLKVSPSENLKNPQKALGTKVLFKSRLCWVCKYSSKPGTTPIEHQHRTGWAGCPCAGQL